MAQKLNIVKIGGNIISDDTALQAFCELFSEMEGPKILVHGGGKKASEVLRDMGIVPKMANGRRITDAATLEVVTMVYGGLTNKTLVALLQEHGCNAIGLSGADANTIRAHKRPVGAIDYGFAGDIDHVDKTAIGNLLQHQFVPIFCALTHNGKGQLLNTNADTIASEIAIAMAQNHEVTLHYCFEKKGVLENIDDEASVIPHIDSSGYHRLLQRNVIADGMLPKLQNCFHALQRNVARVCIGDISMLQPGSHTFTTLTL